MRIGVVTVTFNSASVICPFLRDCLAQNHPDFHLFIVDNASGDETLHQVKRVNDPRLTLISSATNIGVSAANNLGIKAAISNGCEAILLINNDVEFGPDLIRNMVQELDRLKADMVCPKILFFEPKNVIWCAGGRFLERRGYSVEHFGEGKIDGPEFQEARAVDYAPTTCLLVRSAVFREVGLLDPRFFIYFEDADWVYRALKAGNKLFYTPAAALYHKVSSLTGGARNPLVSYHFTKNRILFLKKHRGLVQVFAFSPVYLAYLFLRRVAGKDDHTNFVAKLRGMVHGIWDAV